jgi:hypothetical protein
MRKLVVATTLAALGVGLLATPASASFDHHFRVFEKLSFHEIDNGFRYRGKLFDPQNRHNRVGRDHGVCKFRRHNALRCRGTSHLNGEIGGFGDIKYRGNLRRGDTRLNVVGGSGDFNGVAGKSVFRDLNESGTKEMVKFDLVR